MWTPETLRRRLPTTNFADASNRSHGAKLKQVSWSCHHVAERGQHLRRVVNQIAQLPRVHRVGAGTQPEVAGRRY
jgi:hypothetical protein